MKKLLTIAALTLLTSTAFANTEVGDTYAGKHISAEKAHDIQMGSNEAYGSMMIKQPADHKDTSNQNIQRGEGENYGSMMIKQPPHHKN